MAGGRAGPDVEIRPGFTPPATPEIVDATPDGRTLVATQDRTVGVWDFADPANPLARGFAPPAPRSRSRTRARAARAPAPSRSSEPRTLLVVDENKPNRIRRARVGAPGYAELSDVATVDP